MSSPHISKLSVSDFHLSGAKVLSKAHAGGTSDLVQLKAHSIEKLENYNLTITAESLDALVEYAQAKLDRLPEQEREAIAGSSDRADVRRPAFIIGCAQEFCQKFNQPFILDTTRSSIHSDAYPAIRHLGYPTKDGYETDTNYSPATGIWGTLKTWLKMDQTNEQNTRASLADHGAQKTPQLLNEVHASLATNAILEEMKHDGKPAQGPSN